MRSRELLLLFAAFIAEFAFANQMTDFEIRHCAKGSCYIATGKQSFVSFAQDSLSSSQVRLKMFKFGKPQGQVFECASFNYDLVTQLLICDNQAVGKTSLTISSQLHLTKVN